MAAIGHFPTWQFRLNHLDRLPDIYCRIGKKEELSSVSGQVGLISSVAKTFGPGIAAVIINLINYIGGFLLDALSFGYLTYVIKDYEPLQTENGAMKKKVPLTKVLKGDFLLFAHHDIKWLLASFLLLMLAFKQSFPC
ncbi:hypothetical protein SDC49_07955 [Lactobacillus sp. R2/2]|nr:hypothetical protein [Lactobacillus sp. R2/2]